MKILLNYSPTAKALSDWEIEHWYASRLVIAKNHHTFATFTSNQLVVTRFRVGLVEGDFDELVLCYNGFEYDVDKADGHVDWWNVVPDIQMGLHMRLI